MVYTFPDEDTSYDATLSRYIFGEQTVKNTKLGRAIKEVRARIAKDEGLSHLSAYNLSLRCGLRVNVIQKWELGDSLPRIDMLPGLIKGCGKFSYLIMESIGLSEEDMDALAKSIMSRPAKDSETAKSRKKSFTDCLINVLHDNLEMNDKSEIASKQRSIAAKNLHAHGSR